MQFRDADDAAASIAFARFLQERAWMAESVTHFMSLVSEQFQFLISQAMDGRVTQSLHFPWKRTEIFRPARQCSGIR
jgi:hypothetical protein